MDPVEAVYRSHHDRLWRSLLAYTGDADVASEAAAETYSQAVGRGQELLDPGAWIWRTAFRIAGGLLADRRRTVGAAQVSPEVEHGLADRAGLDSSLVEFLDLLHTLSDRQRAVVILRYAGGFKPTEIAALLETSPGTVRVQLHRAHEHLPKIRSLPPRPQITSSSVPRSVSALFVPRIVHWAVSAEAVVVAPVASVTVTVTVNTPAAS